MTRGPSRQSGHYNPYTHEYVPRAGLRGTRRGEGEEGGGEEWGGDWGGEGGPGEDDWDEELEAVDLELASMEGSLDLTAAGEMEWEVEEEEVAEEDECGVGRRGRKGREKKSGRKEVLEHGRPFRRREEGESVCQQTHKYSNKGDSNHLSLTKTALYSAIRPNSKGSRSLQDSLTTRTITKRTKVHGMAQCTTSVADSPLPVPKKQPGQSIYRAPGQQDSHQE